MAVLVEGISTIIRKEAININVKGGWNRFLNLVPNQTLCFDDQLARVGFMSPFDVEKFARRLQDVGLELLENDEFIDFAIVDQRIGPTRACKWLEFSHITFFNPAMTVAICEFISDSGRQAKNHSINVAFPENWDYERSLSRECKFYQVKEMQNKLKFLRSEKGGDIYMDLKTGEELFIERISTNLK